jgi:hypothetical protein
MEHRLGQEQPSFEMATRCYHRASDRIERPGKRQQRRRDDGWGSAMQRTSR